MQCTTLTCILLTVSVVTYIVVHSLYLRDERELLTEKIEEISTLIQSEQDSADLSIATIAKQHDLLIKLDNGRTFYSDDKWKTASELSGELTDEDIVTEEVSTEIAFTSGFFNGNNAFSTLSAYCSVLTHDGETITVIAHSDMSDIGAKISQLLTWILLIALVSILVAVLSSYYVATRIINPFIEINHTVQCYSRGDFSKRIHLSGKDEAAQLGRSFNEMAEQLRNLEATRRSFVANVSHELRSPLTSMRGFLEAMCDGTIPKEDYEHYIELVLSETKRMTIMVNDLLDLARIESGTIMLNYENFDINELVRRTLITFEARFVDKNIDLDVRFAQEQCFVYADSTQISQVVRNLIDNALKYSPENSKIYISTYSLRKDVFVSIRDTGVGIPQEDVPHVFDRFYKVEKAHTPSPQVGSGLGLSIVKRIIEQHGQTITVRSAKGKGTQFTFSLQKASPLKRVMDGGKKNG